jgi:hypothetical protein
VGFLGDWASSSTQGQHDGHLARAMRRFGTDTAPEELTVNPATLTFDAADTSVKTVTVTKTAAAYDATTAAAFGTDEWITITKSAGSFTVSVREYTAAEARANDYKERTGWITVVAGFAPIATVTVTQSAPARPPLNLAGTWNWTGEQWSDYPKKFTAMSGSVTATYNESLGYWILTTLPENQAGSTMMGGPRVDGGIALRVDADNKVTFAPEDVLDIWADFGGMFGMFRGYYNFATFYSMEDLSNVATPVASMQYGLPAEHVVEIPVSSDGNTITFPGTGIHNSVECDYGFGFGVGEITSLTDHSRPSTASPTQAGGVWRNLVFTRAN